MYLKNNLKINFSAGRYARFLHVSASYVPGLNLFIEFTREYNVCAQSSVFCSEPPKGGGVRSELKRLAVTSRFHRIRVRTIMIVITSL